MKKAEADLAAEVKRWFRKPNGKIEKRMSVMGWIGKAMNCPIGFPISRSDWKRSGKRKPS